MPTPVLIAAYKEEAYIGDTLERLPASVEPFVLVNGEPDGTADIARSFGANTLVFEEAGKLPAIQGGLRALGKRALEPVLFTDADTHPLLPNRWTRIMTERLEESDGPACVAGLIGYNNGPVGMLRTGKAYQKSLVAHRANVTDATSGANMGIKLHDESTLQAVLDLPHIWPGEDRAIADVITERGGDFEHILDPRVLTMTSARWLPSLKQRFTHSREEVAEITMDRYMGRAAPGVQAAYGKGELIPVAGPITLAD